MKGIIGSLLVASVVAFGAANQCPTDWNIEKLLPHEDCDKFYKCTYGEPVAVNCPSGLYYNIQTEQCDWIDNVNCGDRNVPGGSTPQAHEVEEIPKLEQVILVQGSDGSKANQCPTEQESDWNIEKLLPHEDCDKFYKCAYGKPVTINCPSGLYYNIQTEQCDWIDNVDCGDRNVPGREKPQTNEIEKQEQVVLVQGNDGSKANQCPSEQESDWSIEKLVPHEDCDKFYKCTYGKPVVQYCNPGLYYNPTTEQCDWPENVQCGDRNVPGSVNSKPEEPKEEEPKVEEPETDKNDGENAPKENNSERENAGFLENGCPVDPQRHYLLPHESNCSLFYYCVWGRKVQDKCAEGTRFNRLTQVCDWPDAAGCSDVPAK